MQRKRTWTINGDFAGLGLTGVTRCARETTLAIDLLAQQHHKLTEGLDIRLVCPVTPQDLPVKAIEVVVVKERVRPRVPQLWVQAQLPFFAKSGLISFCNLAPLKIPRHIVCIHDLQTLSVPGSYSRAFNFAHRIMLPILGRSAFHITTVSEFSKSQLIDHKIAPADKITVVYNGAGHAMRWQPGRSTIAFGEKPFVLALGQRAGHKNLKLVLQTAPLLQNLGLDVFVSGNLSLADIDTFGVGIPANLRLLGRISDDDFAAALTKAVCFLLPSRAEGFGLPLVEAMSWGCPVVASSAPSLPEIGGDAALYAHPDDCQAWAEAITQIFQNPGLRQQMKSKSLLQAKNYSWARTAEIYLQLMAKADGLDHRAGELAEAV